MVWEPFPISLNVQCYPVESQHSLHEYYSVIKTPVNFDDFLCKLLTVNIPFLDILAHTTMSMQPVLRESLREKHDENDLRLLANCITAACYTQQLKPYANRWITERRIKLSDGKTELSTQGWKGAQLRSIYGDDALPATIPRRRTTSLTTMQSDGDAAVGTDGVLPDVLDIGTSEAKLLQKSQNWTRLLFDSCERDVGLFCVENNKCDNPSSPSNNQKSGHGSTDRQDPGRPV